ncbi:sigma-70 family RNA polymerase sigma factor [Nannocystis pusilla]|uniref:Sigma-70 family RNA polymerase sigma factor n=1 Tax=Nannocystis pusilla TaxID=889268 RepID=A0A9X3IXL5_9BACT|nr:sigma-70 family RNA polymerase sigma factor [Nannocystis pusilla]MCY1008577.1 sigma-70 family RNA polymerase sigma factor [Nannocystis pusilla]
MPAARPQPAAPPAPGAPTREAVAALYRAHARELWRALGRLGVQPAAVEDALHELFIVVQRRLPEFEHRAAIRTWLYAIAVRIARKSRDRTRRDSFEPEPAEWPSHERGPDQALLDAEALRMLDSLLAELDEDKREVFVLHEVEELSAPQIAAILEVNVNTVYSRLREAKRAFARAHARRRLLGRDVR